MKKLALALTALAAFTGSAVAADMPARAYSKAPPPVAPVMSWTGCWISGGGGYGIDRIDHDSRRVGFLTGATQNSTSGLDGWLVTAGVGCDYQFNNRWLVGAFVDGTWSNIKGDFADRIAGVGDIGIGRIKNDWSWSIGGRVGYLVAPNVLTYLNAGYTQTHFKPVDIFDRVDNGGLFTGIQLPGQTFNGVFVGSGVEYSFDWLPGLFLKTEGRAAWFDRKDSIPTCVTCGSWFARLDNVDSRRPVTYIAKTELVYRFNWGKQPVVARY